ncbi:MAG: hypothetical protein H6Q19_538 [Bacteroidetes bacterium]|nr:hypothetical protein [Bacteroidota bacterium]
MSKRNNKILIAYFSRRGMNYLNGKVVNLQVGNTEVIAKKIQMITGGDLFEIRTAADYPSDYMETTRIARNELRTNARPVLAEYIEDIENYSVIYLGYPNWWGTFPMAVRTFLEFANFKGKTIIPFCTHEGGGFGHSETDIRKLCPDSILLPGIAIQGGSAATADNRLQEWLIKSNS